MDFDLLLQKLFVSSIGEASQVLKQSQPEDHIMQTNEPRAAPQKHIPWEVIQAKKKGDPHAFLVGLNRWEVINPKGETLRKIAIDLSDAWDKKYGRVCCDGGYHICRLRIVLYCAVPDNADDTKCQMMMRGYFRPTSYTSVDMARVGERILKASNIICNRKAIGASNASQKYYLSNAIFISAVMHEQIASGKEDHLFHRDGTQKTTRKLTELAARFNRGIGEELVEGADFEYVPAFDHNYPTESPECDDFEAPNDF
jgi:hypothetical protein